MDRTHIDPGSTARRPASGSATAPALPKAVASFRLLRCLGEGGMGAVYLAYDEVNDRQVAIKVLADTLSSNPSYVERFNREARSGGLLNHPNIVRCYGAGRDKPPDKATPRHYLVMEFVDGISALTLLERHGRLAVADAVHIALNIARGLEHAHSRNIIHRDIKPDNILITRAGVAKLSDLGLAKQLDETSHLTAAKQGFGTPWYMPYEQGLNAKQADARSDIYALGATLYHLVAGEVPFPGTNHLEVMEKKNLGDFPPASVHNPEVPPLLDQVLDRMLAREPKDRYQTASELIVDLDRSGLAARVPSFADPERARQDPDMLKSLSAGQATMPDLCPADAKQPALVNGHAGDTWYLRRRDASGEWCHTTATTAQIVQRLRAGRLSARVEASHKADGEFQSLASYSEFRDVQAAPRRKKPPQPSAEEVPPERPPSLLRAWPWVACAAAAGVAVGLVVWWLLSGG
jgi:serine/threonine-protein kinase